MLFIGTRKGLWTAEFDASGPWRIAGPFFKGWKVTAVERLSTDDYLVATGSDVYGPALHRGSPQSGWIQLPEGPAFEPDAGRKLIQIWTLSCRGDVCYAGVAEAGLFRSDDQGSTWTSVSGLNDHPTRAGWIPGAGGLCAHTIMIDPADENRMWCEISAVGVFRTEDGGKTWLPRNSGITRVIPDEHHDDIGYCVHALAADPSDSSTIYRQDHTGMYRTTHRADTWTRIESGLPSGFGFPLVVDNATGNLFCFPQESDEYRISVGGRVRVYRSSDRGDSWHACTRGLPQEHAYMGVLRSSMAVDSCTPCGVYFGTTSGRVFASGDDGESWAELPCCLPRILCLEVFTD
jgi:photosystem II stability/assembly factor-like uncharacterized protein